MPTNEHLALLRFHGRRLSALAHRARVAIVSQGPAALLRKLAGPAGTGVEATPRMAPPALSDAGASPRLLVIDTELPRPDRDSGSLRMIQILKLLREAGHAIDFLAERGASGAAPLAALHDIGVRVLPARSARAFLAARVAGADYRAVIVCRYHLAEYWLPLLRARLPQAKLILDTVDLHHLRESREAASRGSSRLQALAASTRRRELAAIAASDEAWVVSPEEQRLLQSLEDDGHTAIRLVPNLHAPCASLPDFDDREGLLFVGGAGHPPNVDAIRWLLQDIVPRLLAQRQDLRIHLVGAGLSAFMPVRLPQGVVCHDHVPDLSPLFASVRMGIAPLRFGAGVKGKVSQCLSLGLPMVVTSCAAEGMHLEHGTHALIADTADAFATEILRLHDDRALWETLARNGHQVIERHFSPSSLRATLDAALPPPTSP